MSSFVRTSGSFRNDSRIVPREQSRSISDLSRSIFFRASSSFFFQSLSEVSRQPVRAAAVFFHNFRSCFLHLPSASPVTVDIFHPFSFPGAALHRFLFTHKKTAALLSGPSAWWRLPSTDIRHGKMENVQALKKSVDNISTIFCAVSQSSSDNLHTHSEHIGHSIPPYGAAS